MRHKLENMGQLVYNKETAEGEIKDILADGYIVVKWFDIPGEWHYTTEQAKRLENINEDR